MRTVVDLDADVLAAVDALCRERGIGVSEAVNVLVRHGSLVPPRPRRPGVGERFVVATPDRGLRRPRLQAAQTEARPDVRIDVTNVAQSQDLLNGHTGGQG